ncbi:MAG: hypothetical protein ACREML_08390 [Vulcanimicrobiaceae bacterium]
MFKLLASEHNEVAMENDHELDEELDDDELDDDELDDDEDLEDEDLDDDSEM